MFLNYILVVIIIIFSNVESQGRKRINVDKCFTNVSHQKIHLKEPEVLETEYVSSVVKIKVKLIKELNIKI